MRSLIVIAHNLRSTHNVGSLLRTAEGSGVQTVILSGYTPYPREENDPRLPHIAAKVDRQIHKTALGAEQLQAWQHVSDLEPYLSALKDHGYVICALEQAAESIALPQYRPAEKIALILGREVEGLESAILKLCDLTLEIPMFGQKESYNVVQAAAMALYHCRFAPE